MAKQGGLGDRLFVGGYNLSGDIGSVQRIAGGPAALDVTVTEGNQLTIQGERAAPDIQGAVWVRQERPAGRFTRAVTLPALVDADKVEAVYADGVLKLTLPKHEAAKPRKVQVRAGQ